ncbi:MAG TPA: hypothetical protein VN763_14405, partial [Saprospiraceae bacterium]|nr:hypothetical protein [Saprospiraceae bacterium]
MPTPSKEVSSKFYLPTHHSLLRTFTGEQKNHHFHLLKKKKPVKSKSILSDDAKNSPASPGTHRPSGKNFGLIIAVFAFLLYVQSISFGFVLDDEATVSENHLVQEGLKGIP